MHRPVGSPTRARVREPAGRPALEDYDTVVIQMPSTPDWLDAIERLRGRGARVFYEVDWHLHAHVDDVPTLRGIESLMRACDGVLCATPFLAERYAAFNPNVSVCANGLDLRGYALAEPARDTVTIGCASTTMTVEDIADSVTAIAELMRARPAVRFASLGQPVADLAANLVGADRCTALPMVLVEQYPAALSDVRHPLRAAGRLAPAPRTKPLRWLEARALGTPLVADPETYPNAVPARDADELAQQLLRLVDDAPLSHAARRDRTPHGHRRARDELGGGGLDPRADRSVIDTPSVFWKYGQQCLIESSMSPWGCGSHRSSRCSPLGSTRATASYSSSLG